MTYQRLLILLLAVFTSCSFGQSQEVGKDANVDGIYKNFLGNWKGSSERVVGGQPVQETIELAITEEPQKHRLRLDYVYNHKVDIPGTRRFLKLDPSNEIVTMQWNGYSSDRCAASSLKEFAQTGLGDFTVLCRSGLFARDRRIDRMTFHLGIDTLEYEWALSTDGQIYKPYSKFSFKRKN